MPPNFLLYGSTGFVGAATARLAVRQGLRPILAGRNAAKVSALAAELGLEHRVFTLDDTAAMDTALQDVAAVLHCAGPYIHTFKPMVEGCLRNGAHYLDITGEFPVYEALAARDAEARARGVMILPGVGFDVVPTDCLAAHLKRRLPSAEWLTLAFYGQGPAGIPPGTMNTLIEHSWMETNIVRRNGRIQRGPDPRKERAIDFGHGPLQATLLGWGDVFTAYYSTGIPNVEDYMVMTPENRRLILTAERVRSLLRPPFVRKWLKRLMRRSAGSTPEQRARLRTSVWGEVEDSQGRKATARLHGPEAGVVWTALTSLLAVQRALAGDAPPGFQTPALAYGPDFVLASEGVTREDLD